MWCTDKIQVSGRTWRLHLTADRVLAAIEVLSEQDCPPDILTSTVCRLIVCGRVPRRLQANVLQEAFKCIQDDAPAAQQNGPQTLDFSQDWGLIHAAFLQAYGIDLDKHLCRMHWRRFLSLLRSIPDGTKLAWVQEIRATPMPKPTRHNGEERARLSKLKTFYAIRHKQKSQDEQMQSLYDTLATMAKGR